MLLNGAPKGQVLGPFDLHADGHVHGLEQWKFTYYVYVPAQYKPGHAAAIMIFTGRPQVPRRPDRDVLRVQHANGVRQPDPRGLDARDDRRVHRPGLRTTATT